MARTITISVGDELQNYAQQLVDSGQYSSVSEVIRDSLRKLQEQKAQSTLAHLQQLIDEGESSGNPVKMDVDTFLKKTKVARQNAR